MWNLKSFDVLMYLFIILIFRGPDFSLWDWYRLLFLESTVLFFLSLFYFSRWSWETGLMAGWEPWGFVWFRSPWSDWESFLCHSCHSTVLSSTCAARACVGVLQPHILRTHESGRGSCGGGGGHSGTRWRRFVPRLCHPPSPVLVSRSSRAASRSQPHTVSSKEAPFW